LLNLKDFPRLVACAWWCLLDFLTFIGFFNNWLVFSCDCWLFFRLWNAMFLVPYAPSGHRPCAVLRSIEQGWEGSYIKHVHRSNDPIDELYRTIGRSVLHMNYMVLRKGPSVNRSRKRTIHYLVRDHRSIGPTYELRITVKDHRSLGPTRTTL